MTHLWPFGWHTPLPSSYRSFITKSGPSVKADTNEWRTVWERPFAPIDLDRVTLFRIIIVLAR